MNDYTTCPRCDGSKYAGGDLVSECCGAIMTGGLASICVECEGHSEPQYCDFCDGTGEVKDYVLSDYIEEQKADMEIDRKMENLNQ